MDDGLTSLDEAFAATVAEYEQAGSDDAEPAQPPGEAQATTATETPSESPVEQPEPDADGGDELAKAMLAVEDDLDTPDASEDGPPKPGSEAYWAQDVQFDTADGPVTTTLEELTKGYLRQSDYTRKTQLVAKEREAVAEAATFYDKFRKDPSGFSRALAVEAGWLEPGDTPAKVKEFASVPSPSEMDEMVEQQVKERLEADPRIQRDAMAEQQRLIGEEFTRIQDKYEVSIVPELRESLVREAINRNNPDIEMLFLARRARAIESQQRASQVRKGAPARPGVPHSAQTDPTAPPEEVESIEDAYRAALAEQQAS